MGDFGSAIRYHGVVRAPRRQEFQRLASDAFAEWFPAAGSAWLLNEYSEAVHTQDHYKTFAGPRPARPRRFSHDQSFAAPLRARLGRVRGH